MRQPGSAIPVPASTTAIPVTFQAPSCLAVWWHGRLAPAIRLTRFFVQDNATALKGTRKTALRGAQHH